MFRRRDREAKKDRDLDEADAPEDLEADLESQAADYLADNDEWLYGPNAQDVLAILDRLEGVSVEDGTAIAGAWSGAPKSDRDAARKAARKLTESDEELARHVQMAREEVGAWLAVAAEYPEFRKAAPDWPRLASQVGEAAIDAATAVILEEDLDEANYQALWKPWTDATDAFQLADDLEELGPEDEAAEDGSDGLYGPNSLAVADFMNRLWLLSPEQVSRLVSSWQETDRDELEAAHESLHDLVEDDPDVRDEIRLAQEQISPWLNGGRLTETASFIGQTGQGLTRGMAGPALADAVAALVAGDRLDAEDSRLLYAPWFNLVGAPPLPERAPRKQARGSRAAGGSSTARK